MLQIEVVYCRDAQHIFQKTISLPLSGTVLDALACSGIYTAYPETAFLPAGIFSRLVSRFESLRNGDRVEIYRPLSVNPMEKRRKVARQTNAVHKSCK